MALKRHEKETLVETLKGDFGRSPHAILIDFTVCWKWPRNASSPCRSSASI